jgi:hypothetical protein
VRVLARIHHANVEQLLDGLQGDDAEVFLVLELVRELDW